MRNNCRPTKLSIKKERATARTL